MIAVNIVPRQDAQVIPFLKDHKYTFTPYKANQAIIQDYEVDGAPMEYVIDPGGKLVKMVRLNSDDNERAFGELVEKLSK